MNIAVIGATGKAGSRIAREARLRGHSVTAILRPGSAGRLDYPYPVVERDLFELTTEDISGFDVVIDAFGTPFGKPGTESLHQTSIEHLVSVFAPVPDVRLLVVGGAGSLLSDRDGTRRVLEEIPEAFRAVPEYAARGFEILSNSGINWTYLSPPKNFDAGGVRTGRYRKGRDRVILNTSGESYASYADFAVAMVDEAEQGEHIRQRFTIVSDAPFFQDTRQLYNPAVYPFFRKLGYMGVFCPTDPGYGSASMFLGTRHGALQHLGTHKLIDFSPTHNGRKVPFALKAQATELTVQTRHGNISMCWAEPALLLIRGDSGMGLRFEKHMTQDVVKPRGDRGWEVIFRRLCSTVWTPLDGTLNVDAPWDGEKLTHPECRIDMTGTGEDGFLLAIEEFLHAGFVRDSYPTYAAGRSDAEQDWQSFLDTLPCFDAPLEERREEFAYVLWSHLVGPSGKIRRPLMYMFPTSCASTWQMCQNAVALGRKDLSLPVELLLNTLDEASPQGQLTDNYDDMRGSHPFTKPPLMGWALLHLMRWHDLKKEVPRDKLETLYTGFGRFADWYMTYRDDDRDGLPQYEHGNESGTDDSSVFRDHLIVETPDLAALLVLTFEAQADLADLLEKDPDEAASWRRRATVLLEKLLSAYWNGERFIAHVNGTHEIVATDSYLYYVPIILGRRLPQDIIDRMAEDLSVEGNFLTPYGIASENLATSEDFRLGMSLSLGSVFPPANILIVTGLMDAGKEELARKIAYRYCKALKDGGLSFLMNPFRGSSGFLGGSWPACAYMILAPLCGPEPG